MVDLAFNDHPIPDIKESSKIFKTKKGAHQLPFLKLQLKST